MEKAVTGKLLSCGEPLKQVTSATTETLRLQGSDAMEEGSSSGDQVRRSAKWLNWRTHALASP